MTRLGETLRTLREAKGLTQKDLSALAGIGHTHISEIERGYFLNPREKTIRKLSDALRCGNIMDLVIRASARKRV